MSARSLLVMILLVGAHAVSAQQQNVVIRWDSTLLQSISNRGWGAPLLPERYPSCTLVCTMLGRLTTTVPWAPSFMRFSGDHQTQCTNHGSKNLFGGKTIRAWGGPGKGVVEMDGRFWMPYQQTTNPTPPFPEYVSGHSTYSSAAAEILKRWTGSDHFNFPATVKRESSKIERGTSPTADIRLHWETFSQAADQAGISRRYGGIHFKTADLAGRTLGRLVAQTDWRKATSYFDGVAPAVVRMPILRNPGCKILMKVGV